MNPMELPHNTDYIAFCPNYKKKLVKKDSVLFFSGHIRQIQYLDVHFLMDWDIYIKILLIAR